jgi:tetratricopeptide (TPR) repeat protein
MGARVQLFNPPCRPALAPGAAARYKEYMRGLLPWLLVILIALASSADPPAADARILWGHAPPSGNPLIRRGAQALEEGRIAEGISLTQAGLDRAPSPRAAAVGFANLCAGYAMLKRWNEALPHCNRAIALDPEDWKPYNNRAAIFVARGELERAVADVKRALEIAPDSPTVLKSAEVVRESKRMQRERQRTAKPA